MSTIYDRDGDPIMDVDAENLQGADLQCANLQGADLQGADLWGADLQDANLRDANLQDANLQDAILRGADLWGANLQGADLQVLILGKWTAYVQKDHTRIGCKYYPNDKWLGFTDNEISEMGAGALEYWHANKNTLLASMISLGYEYPV